MVSFLQGLGAFGSGALQGFEQGENSAYQRKMRRAQDEAGSVIMATLGGGLGQMPQPQMQPGQPSQPMQLPSAGGGQYADLIRQEATKRGIDPNIALAVYGSEGRGGYVGDQGSSFGPFQLHYGGVAPGGNRVPGLGDEFTKTTGLDARDPRTVPQQIGFALDKAKEGGWGPWHGWKGDPRAGLPGGGGGGSQPPAMPQQGGDWRSFAQRIIQTNPNISHEGFLLALQSVQPFMNMEGRQQMQELNMLLREQALQQRESAAGDTREFRKAQQERWAREDTEKERANKAREQAAQGRLDVQTQKAQVSAEKAAKDQTKIKSVVAQIDKVIGAVEESERTGYGVTGIEGRLRRSGGEFLFGGHKASDFETNMRALQMQVPRILAGIGRLNKGDQDYANALVRGLGTFQSPEEIKSGLQQLKEVLGSLSTGEMQTPAEGGAITPAKNQSLPPMPNARQAPDGKWYIEREGRFFEVRP